jgi:hypothetical protein
MEESRHYNTYTITHLNQTRNPAKKALLFAQLAAFTAYISPSFDHIIQY